MTLVEALQKTAADPVAMRATVEQFADAADGWPDHRAPERNLAEHLRQQGDSYRAALILVALLEDLCRFFETPDGDDDLGWHRQQAKAWETWATTRALRRALVGVKPEARRRQLDAVVEELLTIPHDDWGAPDLMEIVRGKAPSSEVAVASFARAGATLDRSAMLAWLDETFGTMVTDDGLMNRIALLREAADDLLASANYAAAGVVALTGLAVASDLEELPEGVAISDERDAVLSEQCRCLDSVLKAAVDERGLELRSRIRADLATASPALLRRARTVLGADEDEAAEDIAELQERRDTAKTDDERFEIDMQLVNELGSYLDDATYLAICRARRWAVPGTRRLLARGRADEAVAEAQKAVSSVEPPEVLYALRDLVRLLLQHGLAAEAEALLGPWAGYDALHAELFVQCLAAQNKPEVEEACRTWFRRRPTPATYWAMAKHLSAAQMSAIRPSVLAELDKRSLWTMLAEIATAEQDASLLARIAPRVAAVRAASTAAPAATTGPATGEASHRAAAREPTPSVGARITHKKFGGGTIAAIDGEGQAQKLTIEFADVGTKILLARFVQFPEGQR
jgi:PcrA/UvrD tudor domain